MKAAQTSLGANGAGRLKTDAIRPSLSLRLPNRCLFLDLLYNGYGAQTAQGSYSVGLHSGALTGGIQIDPFRHLVFEVGIGFEALHLRQKGAATGGGKAAVQAKTTWGPVAVLAWTAEIVPRIGIDLRLLHRFGPRKIIVRDLKYDLADNSISLGLSFFLRH